MGAFILIYGAAAYAVFLAAFLYAIAFLFDVYMPVTVDGPLRAPAMNAALIDALLLGAFALQHSIMARPAFKRWWTTIIPTSIERSTYVLTTSVLLLAIFTSWQPIEAPVWDLRGTLVGSLLRAVAALGWLVVLASTFMISHFELFGLKQIWYAARQRALPGRVFRQTLFYRLVRHPLMTGFLIAFWATPRMTLGHLVFAGLSTGYIVVGTLLEERDLLAHFGAVYERYRRNVPMLIPFTKRPLADRTHGTSPSVAGSENGAR